MKTVHMKLTEKEAEAVQTALLHTRREFLGLSDRGVIHRLLTELSDYDRTRVLRRVPASQS